MIAAILIFFGLILIWFRSLAEAGVLTRKQTRTIPGKMFFIIILIGVAQVTPSNLLNGSSK